MRKYCKALVNIAITVVLLLLVIFGVPRLLVFFSPFVVGWIIAQIAAPAVHFFEEKIRLKRRAGSALVIVAVLAIVVLILYLIGAMLVEQLIGLLNDLPKMWMNMEAEFAEIGRKFDIIYKRFPADVRKSIEEFGLQIGGYLGDAVGSFSTPTINAVGNIATKLPTIVIGMVMALLSSYFFVAERGTLSFWLHKNLPTSIWDRYLLLKKSIGKAVGGYFKAQLKIEVWIYLLLLVGLVVLRVRYAGVIALGIAFLDFLPVFGSGTALIPWAIVKFLSGHYQIGIGLLIIWGVGQLVRQLIQPKMIGDSVGVAPIPTLLLLYIGFRVGGVFGMIVSVPLGLIVYTMYREGVFDTTRNSILILISGLNHFRRLKQEDLEVLKEDCDTGNEESASKK